MTPKPFDLAKLLNPLKVQDFFLNYWERQYLLLEREQSGYYGTQ